MNCCNENLISIHYMSPPDMYKMQALYENYKTNLKYLTTFNLEFNNSTTNSTTLLLFMSLIYQFVF